MTDDASGRGPLTLEVPGVDTPALRREARAWLGDDRTPVVEIDSDGHIVFVGGDWQAATGFTKPAAALATLLTAVDDGEPVRDAIEATLAGESGAVFPSGLAEGMYLAVVPVPSATVAHRVHALVGLTANGTVAPALASSYARYQVVPADVAAAETQRTRRPAIVEQWIARWGDAWRAEAAGAAATAAAEANTAGIATALSAATEPGGFAEGQGQMFGPGVPAIDRIGAPGETGSAADRREAGQLGGVGDTAGSVDVERIDGPGQRHIDEFANYDYDDFETVAAAERTLEDADAQLNDADAQLNDTDAQSKEGDASGGVRGERLLVAAIAVALYVAFQALYLGPSYDWPSPINGLLDSGSCLFGTLCENRIVYHNHIGVLALIAGLVMLVVRFGRTRARIAGERPVAAGPFAVDRWTLDLNGPGIAVGLAVAAVAIVSLQALAGGAASHWVWLVAIGLGSVGAWRSDRDAGRPLRASMGALTFAVGLVLMLVGVSGLWLGAHIFASLILLVLGIAGIARGVHLAEAGKSSFDRFDWLAMVVLSLVALGLGLIRHASWRYAFIGDEWIFYELAYDRLRGNPTIGTFQVGGPNDYFVGLTFDLQAAIMRVAGANVWGWRLSAMLPMVLSVAAMYAFTRWLAGRTAALASGLALAAGHMLLSFSMVPYNNSQSLVAVSASFAALAWAHQRPSAVRFYVLGAAAGSTFLVYAMARLALLPLVVLFVALFRHDLAMLWRRVRWVALGGLATAAPTLFSWQNWQALLKATPVEAEDPVRQSGGVLRQLFENTFAGWLSFIGSDRNSHYVVGPHLDVISAVLLIVGLAWAIVRSRRDPPMRWFVFGAMFLWTAINAVQQYAQISNTRSFMIPLVYCVLVGLGVHALSGRFGDATGRLVPRRGLAGLALVGLVVVGLNQWHISGHANERQHLTEQAWLVREFQMSESVDGDGMPVHVAWAEAENARLTMILRAHGVAPERMVIVPTNGTMPLDRLCSSTEPRMVVLDHRHPRSPEWRSELERCWGSPGVEVVEPTGWLRLVRLTNTAGLAELDAAPAERFRHPATVADHQVNNVIDLATDGTGVAYALVRDPDGGPGSIHQLGGESFEIDERVPVDFDITPSGHFVVVGAQGDSRLSWYDGAGNRVAEFHGHDDLPSVGGVATDGDLIWVTDAVFGRAIALRAVDGLDLIEIRTAAGGLIEPGSIAPGTDGGIWINDGGSGRIVLVDADDQVEVQLEGAVVPPISGPRMSSSGDGSLLLPIPAEPAVRVIAGAASDDGADGSADDAPTPGAVIDVAGGVVRPIAVTARRGEIVVADGRWHEQSTLAVDDAWSLPSDRGVVRWGEHAGLVAGQHPDTTIDFPSPLADVAVSIPVAVELADSVAVQVTPNQTWQPFGVAVLGVTHGIDVNGPFAMAADTSGRLVRLDASGAATDVIGVAGANTFISDLSIAADGTAWVLDAGAGRLHLVSPDGAVTSIVPDGIGLGNARGIGRASGGGMWVASTATASIGRLDENGTLVTAVAMPGRQPSDIVELADGTLWIVDSERLELVHTDQSGAELTALAIAGFVSNESPHLALSPDEQTIWVSHPELSEVLALDAASGELRAFAGALSRPDGARVDKAIGIAAASNGSIWVTDSNGSALLILRPE